jgi:glutamate-5-semialdehyde dehydrogenase
MTLLTEKKLVQKLGNYNTLHVAGSDSESIGGAAGEDFESKEQALQSIGQAAKKQARSLAMLTSNEKSALIKRIADALEAPENLAEILKANITDLENFKQNGGTDSLADRLTLTEERIKSIADDARKVADLPDPVGEILSENIRPNGLKINKVRVPIGVVGVIYEARPNVTVDVAVLCIKTGNACILRGGKEAINTNIALTNVLQKSIASYDTSNSEENSGAKSTNSEGNHSLNSSNSEENSNETSGLISAVQLITDTSRENANEFMKLQSLDVLIPRGGAGLINAVKQNATVPIIETGVGNCHLYVDEFADLDMAESIIINAKTSRVSVCNSAEKLLIHSSVATVFLPRITASLEAKGVEVRSLENANDDELYGEYLDYKIGVLVVNSAEDAIDFINKYSSGHSESIITNDVQNAQKFLKLVDSAAVYHNASTRFTDGGEFGFGAEIGISTQKLHARGPMGLPELTSYKYQIFGDGQIR